MDPALAAECAHKLDKQKALLEALERGNSEVAQFYDDATIFVTGGSGFLGKQLIEKLFRSCNVKRLYVLLREKKKKMPQLRLQEILTDSVYDSVRKQKPDFASKIFALDGDVGELRLGLSEEDWRRVTEEVDVIFHMAATVNFNADMVSATLINVRGTREVLLLCKTCAHLRSVVHVSTAYCNAIKSRINKTVYEQFYESPVLPEELVHLAENNDMQRLNELFQSRGRQWLNTYSFTKAVAEELARGQAGLPLCVVRPATVIAAYREPAPGWADPSIVYGASGIAQGVIMGNIHTILANENIRLDLVPVDVVNNASIAAAYVTGKTHTTHVPTTASRNTKIYTVTNTRKPLYHGKVVSEILNRGRDFASPSTMWYIFVILTNFKIIYHLLYWLLHYIPAAIVDGVLFITGQRPRLLKIYRKITSLTSVFEYFMRYEWKFDDSNTLTLYNNLNDTDKDLFNCDMAAVDTEQFIEIWILGIRKYIIKDGLRGTDRARKQLFYMKLLHYFVLSLYTYLIFKLTTSIWFDLHFIVSYALLL